MLLFLGIHLLLALLFFFSPQMDLGFSSLFYTPGQGFIDLETRSSSRTLPFLPWITKGFVAISVLLLIRNIIASWRHRQTTTLPVSTRTILFLLFTLGLGPGLMVNVILKDQSGRARPYQIQAFGGDKTFTPIFAATAQCQRNCSFVSGDAALGYFFFAFAFVARKRRAAIALSAYTLGTAIGLVRIAQGAHFLSDVIFAGFFTILVAWILSILLLRAEEDSPVAADLTYSRAR